MYVPPLFRDSEAGRADTRFVRELLTRAPFATLLSPREDSALPYVSHLPLIAEWRGDRLYLIGHCARANPHGALLDGRDCTVIFHGPHAYISPRWYVTPGGVPTWNYEVVQVEGHARVFTDESELVDALRKLSDQMESAAADPWRFEIPDDLARPGVLVRALVGFEIEARSITAKRKLSQNRSEADHAGALDGLLTESPTDAARAVAEAMRTTAPIRTQSTSSTGRRTLKE